jgi:hypothetical protein
MNTTRFEVPLTLPAPHFDDERTVATARQVEPIGRAKVTESWRKLRTLLPLILLATVCGAVGAAAVNYFGNQRAVTAVAQTSNANSTVEPKVEASPIAVAASAQPTPSIADKNADTVEVKNEAAPADNPETKNVTEPAREKPSDKPAAATQEKKNADTDATKLTRKRRVNPSDEDAAPTNKKGAGRIADIFGGPNP